MVKVQPNNLLFVQNYTFLAEFLVQIFGATNAPMLVLNCRLKVCDKYDDHDKCDGNDDDHYEGGDEGDDEVRFWECIALITQRGLLPNAHAHAPGLCPPGRISFFN